MLPVRIGTKPYRKTVLLKFVVVDIPYWPYNASLGRPFLNKAKAVTATYCLKVKFPTVNGIGEIKGCQGTARQNNLSAFKNKGEREVCQITKKKSRGKEKKNGKDL
ncbi:hypothetical protein ACOSQ4_012731 [Xanthoceras sorbifolium]